MKGKGDKVAKLGDTRLAGLLWAKEMLHFYDRSAEGEFFARYGVDPESQDWLNSAVDVEIARERAKAKRGK